MPNEIICRGVFEIVPTCLRFEQQFENSKMEHLFENQPNNFNSIAILQNNRFILVDSSLKNLHEILFGSII